MEGWVLLADSPYKTVNEAIMARGTGAGRRETSRASAEDAATLINRMLAVQREHRAAEAAAQPGPGAPVPAAEPAAGPPAPAAPPAAQAPTAGSWRPPEFDVGGLVLPAMPDLPPEGDDG